MSYIEALKKPTHNKAFSSDFNPVTPMTFPKSDFMVSDEICHIENEPDNDEEEKAKINNSFSVEIKENMSKENNPSQLYVGNQNNNRDTGEQKVEKKEDFLNFVNGYINYFEESNKNDNSCRTSFISTKKKKVKNFNFSAHENRKVSQTSPNDEINNIFALQTQKILKNKTIIEDMRKTQKTLVQEIADHQEREKAHLNVLDNLFIEN